MLNDTARMQGASGFLTSLNPAEQELVACAKRGTACAPPSGKRLVIGAELIRRLITESPVGDETLPIHPSGIELFGAVIVGPVLDLDGAPLRAKLWFEDCIFTASIDAIHKQSGFIDAVADVPGNADVQLTDGRGSTLGIVASRLRRLRCNRVRLTGNLYVDYSDITYGIGLHNAQVDGQLSCRGARLGCHDVEDLNDDPRNGLALDGRTSRIGGSVYLTRGRNHRELDVAPPAIRTLASPRGMGYLLRLLGRQGPVTVEEAAPVIEEPPSHPALADHSSVRFTAMGKVSFTRSRVQGRLDCRGARISTKHRLADDRGKRVAFHVDGADIGASLMLGDGFEADGEVNAVRTRIGADANCAGGRFSNVDTTGKPEIALNFGSAVVGAGLILDEPPTRKGLSATTIVGNVILAQAKCTVFSDGFSDAKVTTPSKGRIELDGFTYERLGNCPTDWESRQAWLLSQPEQHIGRSFRPQPWAQLIKALKEMGHNRAATILAMKRERAMRLSGSLSLPRRFLNLFLAVTVGHGYRPFLPILWSLAILLPGVAVFSVAAAKGWMTPRSEEVLVSTEYWARPDCRVPVGYRPLDPFYYAVDVFLPILDQQHELDWAPADEPRECAALKVPSRYSLQHNWPGMIDYLYETVDLKGAFASGILDLTRWIMIAGGWILIPLFLGGVSGVMKKE